MSGGQRTVNAAMFRAWYEVLEAIVAQDPDDVAPGNQTSAVSLLHELLGAGVRAGAIRPVVIHSSGPSSFAHLMFRYTLEPAFDWTGEIALAADPGDDSIRLDRLIDEIAEATGIPEHDDD